MKRSEVSQRQGRLPFSSALQATCGFDSYLNSTTHPRNNVSIRIVKSEPKSRNSYCVYGSICRDYENQWSGRTDKCFGDDARKLKSCSCVCSAWYILRSQSAWYLAVTVAERNALCTPAVKADIQRYIVGHHPAVIPILFL
jgi:hypothetical protein